MIANKISAWSFSRHADYRQCPLKAKLKYINKINEPANSAMERGSNVHNQAAAYIKGAIPKMPLELKQHRTLFVALKNQFKNFDNMISVEESWAFKKDWSITRWDDWTGCWLRVKTDCARLKPPHLEIFDWKTGRFREEDKAIAYAEQLSLYSLAGFMLYPSVKTISAYLVYLDSGTDHYENFDRSQLPALKAGWEKMVKPMLQDTRFAPRPTAKCIWCWYGQSGKQKGGPGLCKF